MISDNHFPQVSLTKKDSLLFTFGGGWYGVQYSDQSYAEGVSDNQSPTRDTAQCQ
jgi:hypothetical protein